jgi:hypothetical protein
MDPLIDREIKYSEEYPYQNIMVGEGEDQPDIFKFPI